MSTPPPDRRAILEEIARVEKQISARRAHEPESAELRKLEQRWLQLQSDLVETRAHPRTPFLVDAWLKLKDGTQVPAHTKDVSIGGVCLRTIPGCVSLGDELTLELQLPEEEGGNLLLLDGTVAWTSADTVGVAFALGSTMRVLPLLHAAMARAVASLEGTAAELKAKREKT